jgi:VWFA-related protein
VKHALVLFALAATFLLSGTASGQSPVRKLQLIITDHKDRSIDDVQAADIALKEDGAPVAVESLELSEKPVHYGLLIDVSLSLRSQFPLVLDAARRVISSNTPEDQTFIIRFIDKSEMVQASTSNKAALFSAIDRLGPDRGQTALFDSLYFAAKGLQEIHDPTRRKALVVITDGENRASSVTETELFNLLREGDLKVFIIALTKDLNREQGFIRKSVHVQSITFLERLAKETGGRVFFAEKDLEPGTVDQIAHDLRRQYVLKYRSQNAMSKARHKVEIKMTDSKDKKKRKAILRPAYSSEQLLYVN